MTATIPSLLQPLKDRLAAATPGPWYVEESRYSICADTYRIIGVERFRNFTNDLSLGEDKDTAEFIAAAPTDQAKLIAAIEAVAGLHTPVSLWMTHEDADISYQSKEDALAERTDLTEADLVPFELCSHCRKIEDSPCEGECTMQAGYRESLWPCPTVAALTQALGGDTA